MLKKGLWSKTDPTTPFTSTLYSFIMLPTKSSTPNGSSYRTAHHTLVSSKTSNTVNIPGSSSYNSQSVGFPMRKTFPSNTKTDKIECSLQDFIEKKHVKSYSQSVYENSAFVIKKCRRMWQMGGSKSDALCPWVGLLQWSLCRK